MNQIIRIGEQSATGRYIGAGRDKSGPTAGRSIWFICIIASHRTPITDEISAQPQIIKEYLSMEMQLYLLHVVPFIVLVYLALLLFLHPPREVILATLLGGLTLGIINALVDLIAYYASWWHYTAIGLILQLPLPFYITPILIYGGISYLLF